MDGRVDGRTDGRTNGWTNRRTDGLTGGQTSRGRESAYYYMDGGIPLERSPGLGSGQRVNAYNDGLMIYLILLNNQYNFECYIHLKEW